MTNEPNSKLEEYTVLAIYALGLGLAVNKLVFQVRRVRKLYK